MRFLGLDRAHLAARWALCALLSLGLACQEPAPAEAPPPVDCGDLCGPGTICVDGTCTRTRGGGPPTLDVSLPPDMGIPDAEILPDIPFIDAAPLPDAAPVPDAAPLPDAAPDAAPDIALPCIPEPEQCDGVDNDCDDVIDEEAPRVGDVCQTDQFGACAQGIVACTEGALICERTQSPSQEVCDNIDNDCDGEVDNNVADRAGVVCETGQRGVCQEGNWACNAGTWGCEPIIPAQEETCDGQDNDCDGETDESDPQLGGQCETGGVGSCGEGLFFCAQGELRCSQTFPPLPEVCDGADNDCDGQADETFPEQGLACATDGLGICAEGAGACVEGAVACVQAEPQRDELCDGRDDDCDGETDEIYDRLGEDCIVGIGECARPGGLGCAADGSTYACTGETGEPRAERCDGADNDCDGEIDNVAVPPQEPDHCGACGRACALDRAFAACLDSTCRIARCHPGWVNQDGQTANGCELRCRATDPAEEICDGLDNDCDGITDGPDICLGDAFRFCRARLDAGEQDLLCEGFDVGQFETEFWGPSVLGDGDGEIDGTRFYRLAGPSATGAGHHRRIPRIGPTFHLGLQMSFGQPMAVAMGYRGLVQPAPEVEDEENPPQAPPPIPWQGYGLWFDTVEGAPQLEIRTVPGGDVLWRGHALALADGRRHFVDWWRGADGHYRVFVDGQQLNPTHTADAPHLAYERFDEVTLWMGPLADGENTSEIDALVLREDIDGDGIPNRVDNCPAHSNPDQVDADGNGYGAACDDLDGDGVESGIDACPIFPVHSGADADRNGVDDTCDFEQPLLIAMTRFGTEGPWFFDLQTGQKWRPIDVPPGTRDFAAGRTASALWTRYDSSYGVSPDDGGPELLGPHRVRADWVGDRLLYHDQAFRAVYLKRTEFEVDDPVVIEVPEEGAVMAHASADESHIIAITQLAGDVRGQLFDPLGASLGEPTDLPSPAAGAPMPSVDWHPATGNYLVGGDTGEARGLSLIDPNGDALFPVNARPTSKVKYLPDGSGFVALHPNAEGLVTLTLYRGFPDPEATDLIEDASWIRDHTLDWGQRRAPQPDADGDGLADDSDPCPTRPADTPDEGRLIPLDDLTFDDLQLFWTGQDYLATWTTVDGYRQGRMIRISRDGELLQDFGVINECRSCYNNPAPIWDGDRYRVFYLNHENPNASNAGRIWRSDLDARGQLEAGVEVYPETNFRWLNAIRTPRGIKLGLIDFDSIIRFVTLDAHLQVPEAGFANTGRVNGRFYRRMPFRWAETPDGEGALQTLSAGGTNTTVRAGLFASGVNISTPISINPSPTDVIGVGTSVWMAYTSATQNLLDLRRFDLELERAERPVTVTDTRGQPGNPRLVYNGDQVGIFWLQTVGARRVIFGRWMTPDGVFVGPAVALTNDAFSVGETETPYATAFGAAFDGQKTALLYPQQGLGLIFSRGDVQCW